MATSSHFSSNDVGLYFYINRGNSSKVTALDRASVGTPNRVSVFWCAISEFSKFFGKQYNFLEANSLKKSNMASKF